MAARRGSRPEGHEDLLSQVQILRRSRHQNGAGRRMDPETEILADAIATRLSTEILSHPQEFIEVSVEGLQRFRLLLASSVLIGFQCLG